MAIGAPPTASARPAVRRGERPSSCAASAAPAMPAQEHFSCYNLSERHAVSDHRQA